MMNTNRLLNPFRHPWRLLTHESHKRIHFPNAWCRMCRVFARFCTWFYRGFRGTRLVMVFSIRFASFRCRCWSRGIMTKNYMFRAFRIGMGWLVMVHSYAGWQWHLYTAACSANDGQRSSLSSRILRANSDWFAVLELMTRRKTW